MHKHLKLIGRIGAFCAFGFCLTAGLWILTALGLQHNDDAAVWTGLGLYFIGKAFFVGPMLLLAAEQFTANSK